jgi:hypothetical protein
LAINGVTNTYDQAAECYDAGDSGIPFYGAFPEADKDNIKAAGAELEWVDKDTVRVKFADVPTTGIYDFTIDGFVNPFSTLGGTKMIVKHWPGCTGFA